MRTYVGNGWYIWHGPTDRNIQLRKEDPIYRMVTGLDGYVNYSVQPGYDRARMIDEAIGKCQEADEQMAFEVTRRIIPRGSAIQTYQMKAHKVNRGFRTPEDASVIGRMRQ